MAIYRNVDMSFWTDTKILEHFTTDEKLMYLYVLTNPHTNLSGCYEIGFRTISFETGFSIKSSENLIKSLIGKDLIRYSEDTDELLVVKWYRYNWTNSEKFRKPLLTQIKQVKHSGYREYLMDLYNGIDTVYTDERYGIDTVSDNGGYPIDTTVTVSVSVSDTVTDTDTVSVEGESEGETIERIVEYLNFRLGSNYKPTTKYIREAISARLAEGHTEEDFHRVIDGRVAAWKDDPKMVQYLRPSTLFRPTKFEEYLNAPIPMARVQADKPKSYIEIAEELERQQEGDIWI